MPADDATFLPIAAQIVTPYSPVREMASVRTLFTTEHPCDAEAAGFEEPCAPGFDGGFSVTFDGRCIPSVVINGSDGEVAVVGYHAIAQLAEAAEAARRMAARMTGRAS